MHFEKIYVCTVCKYFKVGYPNEAYCLAKHSPCVSKYFRIKTQPNNNAYTSYFKIYLFENLKKVYVALVKMYFSCV